MRTAYHILLDAAMMAGDIFRAVQLNEDHKCLFIGDSGKTLGSVAPWLFELEIASFFAQWLAKYCPQRSCSIIIESRSDLDRLFHHFRHFLIVDDAEDKELYFRFYDPRILQRFLPTCRSGQLTEFFGPIRAFVLESEDGHLVRYSIADGSLNVEHLESGLFDLLTGLEPGPWRDDRDPSPETKPDIEKSRWDLE